MDDEARGRLAVQGASMVSKLREIWIR